MNIAICAPLSYSAINGTTVYAEQLRNEFNAEIISSNALDWIYFHSKKGKHKEEGCKVIHLPLLSDTRVLSRLRRINQPLINSIINGPHCPGMFYSLLRKDYDIIHSLTLPFLNNYYSLWATKLRHKKCAITPFYIPGVVSAGFKGMLKKFNTVLCCTDYEKKSLGLNNTHVIPMSVNPELFRKADGRRFREKYNIQPDENVVLFVGHANHEKGTYAMLKAAEQVKARFVFMGPHTAGFKSRIKTKNVLLINPQLRNKFDAFAACDVYCMPSRVEAFGITYLEAWASKKPVIAADTPQAREVISSDGLLVKFNNVEQLVNAINESLNRQDLGMKGYEKLIRNYTEDKVMSKLKEIYESIQ